MKHLVILFMNDRPDGMKRFTLVILLLLQFSLRGQIYTVNVDKDIWSPDARIQIAKDVFYPDLKVLFGTSVLYPNISVGLTDSRYNADFIITDSYSDVNIQYDENTWSPDLSIMYGEDILYPDFSVRWVKSGTVNYLIYADDDFLTPQKIICALLPLINAEMDFQFDALNEAFDQIYRD